MVKELLSLALAALATVAAFAVAVAVTCCEPHVIRSLHFWLEAER